MPSLFEVEAEKLFARYHLNPDESLLDPKNREELKALSMDEIQERLSQYTDVLLDLTIRDDIRGRQFHFWIQHRVRHYHFLKHALARFELEKDTPLFPHEHIASFSRYFNDPDINLNPNTFPPKLCIHSLENPPMRYILKMQARFQEALETAEFKDLDLSFRNLLYAYIEELELQIDLSRLISHPSTLRP